MRKVIKWGGLGVLVLLALILLVPLPSEVDKALKRVPDSCTVTGAWRDTDWPDALKQFTATFVMCDGGPIHQVFDTEGSTVLTHAVDGTDRYRVNPDGSLTISDSQGEIKTLAPN